MPYSTDSLHSLGSATQSWTGLEKIIASAFLWLSDAYTPGGAAAVGVVIVVVSGMSTGYSREKRACKHPREELPTQFGECVKWTHRMITLHFLRFHNVQVHMQ